MIQTQHQLSRDLMFLVGDVGRLLRTRVDQLARAHQMTRAQWIILARLERQPGVSQSEMASLCEVEPITVARLIDRLEARGFVERRPDPNDRRIRRLYLLPEAQPLLEDIHRYRTEVTEALTQGFSESETSVLVDGLMRVKSNLCCKDENSWSVTPAAE